MKKILRTFLILTTLVGCATHQNTAQAGIKSLLLSGSVLTTGAAILGFAGYGAYRFYTEHAHPFLTDTACPLLKEKKNAITETLSETKDKITETLSETKDKITETLSETKDKITERLSETQSSISKILQYERTQTCIYSVPTTALVTAATMKLVPWLWSYKLAKLPKQ